MLALKLDDRRSESTNSLEVRRPNELRSYAAMRVDATALPPAITQGTGGKGLERKAQRANALAQELTRSQAVTSTE